MGVLVIAEPPDWRKRLGLLLGLLLLAGVVALAASWAVGRLGQPSDIWTAGQVARAIEQGEVERLIVRGNEVTVETKDGVHALVRKEGEASILKGLRDMGVPEERLRDIEIVVAAPYPRFFDLVARLFCGTPIVILLLGIGGAICVISRCHGTPDPDSGRTRPWRRTPR